MPKVCAAKISFKLVIENLPFTLSNMDFREWDSLSEERGATLLVRLQGDGFTILNPSPFHFTGLSPPLSSERESHTRKYITEK